MFIASCNNTESECEITGTCILPPMKIMVYKTKRFTVDGVLSTLPLFKKSIYNISASSTCCVLGFKTIVEADEDTTFKIVRPVIEVYGDIGGDNLQLKTTGSPAIDVIHNLCNVGCAPIGIVYRIKLDNNKIYLKDNQLTLEDLISKIADKPQKEWGYRMLLDCSEQTTMKTIYDTIKELNKINHVETTLKITLY